MYNCRVETIQRVFGKTACISPLQSNPNKIERRIDRCKVKKKTEDVQTGDLRLRR